MSRLDTTPLSNSYYYTGLMKNVKNAKPSLMRKYDRLDVLCRGRKRHMEYV